MAGRLAQRRSAAADGHDGNSRQGVPISRYASAPGVGGGGDNTTEDDGSDESDESPSTWDRMRSNWRTAASSVASAGLLGAAPASALEGTSGTRHFDQRGSIAREGTENFHGKLRSEQEIALAEAEEQQLRASYEEHSQQRARVRQPQQEASVSALQMGGPQFHEEDGSDGEQHEAKDAVDLEKGLKHPATSVQLHEKLAAVSTKVGSGSGGETEDPEARSKKRLAAISDPDIRAMLDPHSTQRQSEEEILSWSDEKLIELVKNFDLADMEVMMRKLKERTVETDGAQLSAEDLTTSLSCRNLGYSVNGVTMLQNVSAYVRPGQLVAVLGGPDAGITTLLDVLAHRTRGRGEVYGDIFVNRRPLDASFGRQIGYVTKHDTHLPQLTVSETLYFSARLRNPGLTSRAAILRVALTMKLLGLLHCWKTPIGDDIIRGVSGGEKRRVSFGLELVGGHNLILADLPTNGLDSGSALSLLQVYKSTTLIGRSLLCSLVQPSPAIYALLDSVLVLSKGATLYFGPADLAERHFAALGFVRPHAKSVPQFLEELSAAPEKFAGPQRIGRNVGVAGMQSQRPLALLREREERNKRSRHQLIKGSSFAPASGQLQQPHSRWPSAQQVLSLKSHTEGGHADDEEHDLELGGGGSGHPHVEDGAAANLGSSPDPMLPEDLEVSDAGSRARVGAWKTLVNGYQGSVFNDDCNWVLYNQLTPLPVFAEKKKKANQKKKKKKIDAHNTPVHNTQPEMEMANGVSAKAAASAPHAASTAHSKAAATHKPFDLHSPHATSFGVQFSENLARMCVLFYRNRALWLLNFCKSIAIGLIIGSLSESHEICARAPHG